MSRPGSGRNTSWRLLSSWAVAALLVLGLPTATPAAFELSSSYAATPYTLVPGCDLAKPLAVVTVTVRNGGDAVSPARSIVATDAQGALIGQALLPSIAPGESQSLAIPLYHPSSNGGPIGGVHAVSVVIGTQRLAPLTVTVPFRFCAGGPLSARAGFTAGIAQPAAAGTGAESSTMTALTEPAARSVLTAPGPVSKRVLGPPDAPAGLLLAFLGDCGYAQIAEATGGSDASCHAALNDGKVVFHWKSATCTATEAECRVAGYRVYRYRGDTPVAEVSSDRFAVIVPNAQLGSCYVVRAFRRGKESPDSNARCVTVVHSTQRLSLGPTELGQFRAVVHDNTDHGYCTRHSWDDVWAHESWGFVVRTTSVQADPYRPADHPMTIGWLGQYHRGTQPFPCQEGLLQAWRGYLVFAIPPEAKVPDASIVLAFTPLGPPNSRANCFHYLWPAQQWYDRSDNNGDILGVSDGRILGHGNDPLGLIDLSNDRATFDLSNNAAIGGATMRLELAAFQDGIDDNEIAHPTLHDGRYATMDGSNLCGVANPRLEIAYPRTQSTTAPLIIQPLQSIDEKRAPLPFATAEPANVNIRPN